jgi:hypothetical protein
MRISLAKTAALPHARFEPVGWGELPRLAASFFSAVSAWSFLFFLPGPGGSLSPGYLAASSI